MYYIAVFRVRGQTLRLMRELENLHIPASIINTPRGLNIGCGLSIRFDGAYLQKIVKIINSNSYYSFYGIFFVKVNNKGGLIRII